MYIGMMNLRQNKLCGKYLVCIGLRRGNEQDLVVL